MNREAWDIPTRVLHWALAIIITIQLGTGLVIATPGTRVYFYLHEYVGLVAGLVIVLHWLWSAANYDLRLLFPWGGDGWKTVNAEVCDLLHGKLPPGGRRAGLSSFVHGLGLLAVTAMAVTGFVIFLVVPEGRGAMADSTHFRAFTSLSAVHAFFSWFIWAYWVGHVATGLLHHIRREPVFAEIFINGGLAGRDSRSEA